MTARVLLSLVLGLAAVSFAQAQEKLTPEEVGKLARAGVSDELIIARIEQDQVTFTLTADQIVALKKEGVSDHVVQVMLGKAPKPQAAVPKVASDGGNLSVRNASHRDVKVEVNEKDGLVSFSLLGKGSDLARGGQQSFELKPGEYRVAVEGAPTRHTVQLPASLLVRGCETSYVEVMTLTVEDGRGSEVLIMHSEGRVTPGQIPRSDRVYGRPGGYLAGPQMSYLPFVSNNVLLGAGIGAIIGHQSGHRTQGALIGAGAGLFLDFWGSRRW